MKTHQFQTDRSDALRRQLVGMAAKEAPVERVPGGPAVPAAEPAVSGHERFRKPHRTRRILLSVAAAGLGDRKSTRLNSSHWE